MMMGFKNSVAMIGDGAETDIISARWKKKLWIHRNPSPKSFRRFVNSITSNPDCRIVFHADRHHVAFAWEWSEIEVETSIKVF